MTIENSAVVDGAGIDKIAGEIVLMISDHLSWEDEQAHFRLIEKKISKYLDFIRTGQVFESFPQYKHALVRINLIHQHPLTDSASGFLSAVQRELRKLSVGFSHGELPPGY